MKTVIQKQYEDGFLLSEQDVRRLYQIMVDAAVKVNPGAHSSQFHVRLENGSIYELPSVDDVLAIDNTGERSIEYLSICVLPNPHGVGVQEDWRLFIQFQKTKERFRSTTPILIEAEGTSRDWVVLAAGELDERIRLVRRTNLMRLLSKPYMPAVLLMACMFLGALFLMSFTKPIPAHIELERLYQAGKVTNPIEAMLMLEKAKAASRPDSLPLYTFAFLVAGLTLSLGKVCTKLSQLCSTQFDVAAETI